jgi:hypothetical protein
LHTHTTPVLLPPPQIIFGIMPFWGTFRNWAVYKRALPGFNAAGVGLIITSVFSLTLGALQVGLVGPVMLRVYFRLAAPLGPFANLFVFHTSDRPPIPPTYTHESTRPNRVPCR